jgi:hypothetical protein
MAMVQENLVACGLPAASIEGYYAAMSLIAPVYEKAGR